MTKHGTITVSRFQGQGDFQFQIRLARVALVRRKLESARVKCAMPGRGILDLDTAKWYFQAFGFEDR